MTRRRPHPTDLDSSSQPSPLGGQAFPYQQTFYPLGFPVQIETTSPLVLEAAEESWGEDTLIPATGSSAELLTFRLGVHSATGSEPPSAPVFRANGHLLSLIADAENFAVCDLERGFAFGWVTERTARDRSYLRYHLLEAAVLCLLVGSRVTPVHAACVSLHGCGLLLCGTHGSGKSTLAYACARSGFTFTSDDASYVVWQNEQASVRGNAHQVRFRPSASTLFPELDGLSRTPQTEGKPSIEVRTSSIAGITTLPEAPVHACILLNRQPGATTELRRLSAGQLTPHLASMLFPLEGIRARQEAALKTLDRVETYELCFDDLPRAVARLKLLTLQMTKR